MTKGGRIAGGIIALIGGGISLIPALLPMVFLGCDPRITIMVLVTLVCAVLGIIGGILLLTDKTAGGILALIGGTLPIIGQHIHLGNVLCGSWWVGITLAITLNYYLNCIPIIVGGILGLSIGSESKL